MEWQSFSNFQRGPPKDHSCEVCWNSTMLLRDVVWRNFWQMLDILFTLRSLFVLTPDPTWSRHCAESFKNFCSKLETKCPRIFPHYNVFVAMIFTFDPICVKSSCSQCTTQTMLHIKLNQHWPNELINLSLKVWMDDQAYTLNHVSLWLRWANKYDQRWCVTMLRVNRIDSSRLKNTGSEVIKTFFHAQLSWVWNLSCL